MDTQERQPTINRALQSLLLVMLVITFTSCKEGGSATGPEQPVDPQTFEEVIALGGETDTFPESRTTDTLAVSEPETDDREVDENGTTQTKRWICTTRTYSVLDGNGKFPLFNTNADVVYPGNLLQGKTLSNATPSPIVVERAGGTISYNLNNGNLSSTFTVDRVSKSSIQDAMNNIIANANEEVVPAKFQLDIVEVQSKEQLALEMGLNVNTFTTKVQANMSLSTEREYNRFLVKLSQEYYTMSFDLPTSLDQLFDENVTPEQLATYVQTDNPATFISSVTYGRIFYMLVESTSSSQEMESKLDISYGAFRNSVDGSVDVDSFQEMENVKIKVIAYGGDASSTLLAGEATIDNIVNKLAESTDIRSGLPLSYVVRSVERPDKIVGTSIATEYDVVDCELKGILPPQGYRSLVDLFEDGIGAMVHIASSNVVIYNKAGTQYAWYNGNSGDVLGTFDIDDPEGPMGASSFESIGSALQFRATGRLYIFDGDGLRNEFFSYDPSSVSGNTLPAAPIGNYDQAGDSNRVALVNEIYGDSGNFQFANRGFGAATPVGSVTTAYFTKDGSQYALYERTGGGKWYDPLDSPTWFNNNPNVGGQQLFERVGASTWIFFGNSSGRWLLVNEGGDELMEYYSSPQRKFEGPWIIN